MRFLLFFFITVTALDTTYGQSIEELLSPKIAMLDTGSARALQQLANDFERIALAHGTRKQNTLHRSIGTGTRQSPGALRPRDGDFPYPGGLRRWEIFNSADNPSPLDPRRGQRDTESLLAEYN